MFDLYIVVIVFKKITNATQCGTHWPWLPVQTESWNDINIHSQFNGITQEHVVFVVDKTECLIVAVLCWDSKSCLEVQQSVDIFD